MAYDKNETAANDAYLEKRIELSGRVLDRGTDLKIHYLYVGADTSRYHDEPEIKCSIRCEFPQSEYNNLVTLWHDKSVYVIGRVVGKVGPNITMRDCRID